jgi:hypothetical protein
MNTEIISCFCQISIFLRSAIIVRYFMSCSFMSFIDVTSDQERSSDSMERNILVLEDEIHKRELTPTILWARVLFGERHWSNGRCSSPAGVPSTQPKQGMRTSEVTDFNAQFGLISWARIITMSRTITSSCFTTIHIGPVLTSYLFNVFDSLSLTFLFLMAFSGDNCGNLSRRDSVISCGPPEASLICQRDWDRAICRGKLCWPGKRSPCYHFLSKAKNVSSPGNLKVIHQQSK